MNKNRNKKEHLRLKLTKKNKHIEAWQNVAGSHKRKNCKVPRIYHPGKSFRKILSSYFRIVGSN